MNMQYDVAGFPSEHLHIIWHDLMPFLEKALFFSDNEMATMHIYDALMNDTMQLWTASEGTTLKGIVVTEFIRFPNKLICHVVLVAGSMIGSWEHCLEKIEEWAIEEGATGMRAYARPGWKPKAKEHGYKMQYCIYTKAIGHSDENTH